MTELTLDLRLNPQMIHELLRKTAEGTISFYRSVEELMTQVALFNFGDDVPGLMAFKFFEEFALPYEKKVFGSFKHLKCPNLFHSDSDKRQNLEMIAKLGADMFHLGLSDIMDIREVKKRIGDKICLVGNVNPLLLVRGTPKEVKAGCRKCIQKGALMEASH